MLKVFTFTAVNTHKYQQMINNQIFNNSPTDKIPSPLILNTMILNLNISF
jgi:hypothetical protein